MNRLRSWMMVAALGSSGEAAFAGLAPGTVRAWGRYVERAAGSMRRTSDD